MAAKRTSKRKKYKLQDPKRFFGFIAILVLMVLLLVLVIRGCSGQKQQGGSKQDMSSSQTDASQGAMVSAGLGDMQKQTIAWTVGLANMTRGISTVEPDDTAQVPKIYTIVIDPGCGGSDSGNPGHGNVMEKAINLEVALKLKAEIESRYPDVRIVMTRENDKTVSTQERIKTINDANADLAVSLHCDYFAGSAERRGVTTYYRQKSSTEEESSKAEDSSAVQLSISERSAQIAAALQKAAAQALETDDRGCVEERYDILNETNAPTVLMEMVYLTDQSDYAKITNEEYQTALAAALADGIYAELEALYPTRAQSLTVAPK